MRQICNMISMILKTSCKILKFIRELFLNTIFIVILIIIIGIIYLYNFDHKPEKKYFGALYVDLQGIVVDKISTPFSLNHISHEIISNTKNRIQENSLFNIVKAIRLASTDKRITGMILHLDNFIGGDQPSLAYIGKAIKEFKATNKPIYAIGNSYNQSQYYLASFANDIYLSPYGSVSLHGFSNNTIYYKSFLEKLKINSHIFRVGAYKSAVEPLIRNNMSKNVRKITKRWLNISWNNYLNDISSNRKTTKKQIFPDINTILYKLKEVNGNNAQYALNQKLIDKIYTNKEIENILNNRFGLNKKNKYFNSISIYDYFSKTINTDNTNKGNIAIIIVQGSITDNQQTFKINVGDNIAAQIRDARLNEKIKAIILRVNSPGGSVGASELIRNELEAARLSGKPIIVSMGGVAASGGYWISTPANYIIASPNTLTGSIGIFGIINTFENSFKSIGIYNDGVTTSPLADVSLTKGINQQFSDVMQITINNGYETFIKLVANSRHKTIEEINNIAQGKIWIGQDALKNGLIDMLGDFDDAINKAIELANLDHVTLKWDNQKVSFIDQLLIELTQSVLFNVLQTFLPSSVIMNNLQQNSFLLTTNDQQNRYAYCLNSININ
ncbi:Protease 4 [Candidatus Providencia siddallii]|uniref:Protease 4 n=1 Tax=Candidatus Providencia siddallii TaxID=1715285 RepID=A0A0M6WA37_9GAMM|nr:Protease 4 [Candidatus Providencia siddallii]